jgi:hypothetical protein
VEEVEALGEPDLGLGGGGDEELRVADAGEMERSGESRGRRNLLGVTHVVSGHIHLRVKGSREGSEG